MHSTVFTHNGPAICSIEAIDPKNASHSKERIALFLIINEQNTTGAIGLFGVVPCTN